MNAQQQEQAVSKWTQMVNAFKQRYAIEIEQQKPILLEKVLLQYGTVAKPVRGRACLMECFDYTPTSMMLLFNIPTPNGRDTTKAVKWEPETNIAM